MNRYRQPLIDQLVVGVASLQERLAGPVRERLLVAMGAVAFVLLVACVNVANLLLARASARQRELALRSAIGARRGRLARLIMTESLLLAGLGSVGALLLALGMRSAAHAMLAERIPHIAAIAIDWRVMAFNTVLAGITGVVCGVALLPRASRVDLSAVFASGATTTAPSRSLGRRVLLAAQSAVTFVLVVGAALLAQTLWNLQTKARRFEADRLLTVRALPRLPPGVDRGAASREYFASFFTDLTARVSALPGVVSAVAASDAPFAGIQAGLGGIVVGGDSPSSDPSATTAVAAVTPRYFETMGISLLEGREFSPADRNGTLRVGIVNEAFKRRFAPAAIVGSSVTWNPEPLTVVGVVEDIPGSSLRDAATPVVFTPLAQMPMGFVAWGRFTLVVRTQRDDPRAIAPLIRRTIWSIDPAIVIDGIATMEERIAASVRAERQSAIVFGALAGIALAIAAIGVYGVGAYVAAQRTREIGIRMALGAARRDVRRLVHAQTIPPMLAGLAVGLMGAWAATRLLDALLYGVTPLDPAAFAWAASVLMGVALAASYIPARRAMKVDPLSALRTD